MLFQTHDEGAEHAAEFITLGENGSGRVLNADSNSGRDDQMRLDFLERALRDPQKLRYEALLERP